MSKWIDEYNTKGSLKNNSKEKEINLERKCNPEIKLPDKENKKENRTVQRTKASKKLQFPKTPSYFKSFKTTALVRKGGRQMMQRSETYESTQIYMKLVLLKPKNTHWS